jgi:hypothetical protein
MMIYIDGDACRGDSAMLLAAQLPDRDFLQNIAGASASWRLCGSGKLRKRRKTGLSGRGSMDLARQPDWVVDQPGSNWALENRYFSAV